MAYSEALDTHNIAESSLSVMSLEAAERDLLVRYPVKHFIMISMFKLILNVKMHLFAKASIQLFQFFSKCFECILKACEVHQTRSIHAHIELKWPL